MSLKKFLFFIIDPDGKSAKVVNDLVTYQSTPAALPQAPDGNQEISIGWERSPVYKGNIRNFSLPLGFVGDGGRILRDSFYKYNLDIERYMLIKRLTYESTPLTYKEYYKQLYRGQFDFSTVGDDQGGYRFGIGLMEGGLHRQLKAAEGTTYELPFDMDAKNILMDGLYIRGVFRWFINPYSPLSDGYPGMFQLSNDTPIPGLAIFDVQQLQVGGTPDENTLEYFAETTQDIAGVRITGQIVDLNYLGAPGPLDLHLYVFNRISNTLTTDIDLTPADPYPENFTLLIDETIDLVAGDRLFLKTGSAFQGESSLQLEAKSKPLASVIKGFTLYDTGRKLTEKITGDPDNFDSTLLADLVTEFGSEVILTSGDGVRSLEGAGIKTSWAEFWKFTDTLLMAQMTTTDKIRIFNRITAYQPESVGGATELGDIKDLKINPAIDLMGTKIKVGHADQQVDDTNGKYDYNGNMIFKTPVNILSDKEIDLQTNYKASPYEIEQTRANYEGKTTTDKETDNDVFAVAVQPDEANNSFDTLGSFFADGTPLAPGEPLISIVAANPLIRPGMKIKITGTTLNDQDLTVKAAQPWFFGQLIVTNEPLVDEASVNFTIEIIEGQYYTLDRELAVTQLLAPPDDVDTDTKDSLFNVRLSPKRILLRHSAWLAGGLVKYAPGKLVFSSANRNKELIADGVIEKADVNISDLGDPMFLPYYFEFDTVSPVDMPEILEANPNPVFAFTWKNTRYTGFFIRGGIALNDLEEQTFKLLATPDNDLLPLIS